jgi:hypothetical protein
MANGIIALIFDCDGTIAEDTTTKLVSYIGSNPRYFWRRVRFMEKQGWEPTLAYMKLLVDLHPKSGTRRITKRILQNVGKKINFSRGIPRFFKEIKRHVDQKYGGDGVSLRIYVVSSGFEELIRASKITKDVNDIFGCRYEYDDKGVVIYPKAAVSFTEKTKFIYAINKGYTADDLARDPYCVNDQIPPHERLIPFKNMIYIGDGPTDVPCMSLLKAEGCEIFAVYTEPRQGIPRTTYELARQGRFTRGPFTRDYCEGSDLRRALEGEIDGYAQRIIGDATARRRPAVRPAGGR